jgi:hypothetical protein
MNQVPGLPTPPRCSRAGWRPSASLLNKASEKDVYISYASSQGTAVTALSTLLTILLTGQRPDFVHAPDPGALPEQFSGCTSSAGETEKFIQIVSTRDQDTFPEGGREPSSSTCWPAKNAEVVLNHGVVRIQDNDTGSGNAGLSPISFAQTQYFVHEYEPFALITLIKTDGVGAASAIFYTQDITATSGADYTGGGFLVNFAANEFVKTVQIPILDDQIWEGERDRSSHDAQLHRKAGQRRAVCGDPDHSRQ